MAQGPSSKPTKINLFTFGSSFDWSPVSRIQMSHPNSWRWAMFGFGLVHALCGVQSVKAHVATQFRMYNVYLTASAHRNNGSPWAINIVWASSINMWFNCSVIPCCSGEWGDEDWMSIPHSVHHDFNSLLIYSDPLSKWRYFGFQLRWVSIHAT